MRMSALEKLITKFNSRINNSHYINQTNQKLLAISDGVQKSLEH